jgi:hypothetical protein
MKMKTQPRNPWDTAKAVLRGTFIAMNAYIIRTERFQVNDLMLHLKLLEESEQSRPKTSRRREIIKIRAEINEIDSKKSMKQKLVFEKINKINKPLANLIEMRREKVR